MQLRVKVSGLVPKPSVTHRFRVLGACVSLFAWNIHKYFMYCESLYLKMMCRRPVVS